MHSYHISRVLARILSAALAASLAFAMLPAAALAAPTSATGAIQFLCKDSAGYAYPDVGLALYRDETLTAKAGEGTSDANGYVKFTGLATATYWVTVVKVPAGYEKPDVSIPFDAEDGKTAEYTLILQKTGVGGYSQDSRQLKGIEAAGTLSPAFDPDTKRYTLKLDEGTAKTTIRPILSDGSSKLYINGKRISAKTVSLRPGGRVTLVIRVKSDAGKNGYYTVKVVRAKSTNADLSAIAASSGVLAPAFAKETTAYTLTLANTRGWVKIAPKLASKYASYTITVDGRRAGKSLRIAAGATKKMVIRVRAQAGNVKTYTVKITRAISHNAAPARISASAGVLSPAFSPDASAYTLALPASQGSVTLSVKKGDVYQLYWVRVYGNITGKTIQLDKGETKKVTITVKAQAGEMKTYQITISRAE